MPPATPRDFLRVSLQRLDAAELMFDRLDLTLEAQYIGGYSVECSMKAVILAKTGESQRAFTLERLTRGSSNHQPEVWKEKLRGLGVEWPLDVTKRMRRFNWTTDLRYETGRKKTGATRGLLKTARVVYDWAQEQIR